MPYPCTVESTLPAAVNVRESVFAFTADTAASQLSSFAARASVHVALSNAVAAGAIAVNPAPAAPMRAKASPVCGVSPVYVVTVSVRVTAGTVMFARV